MSNNTNYYILKHVLHVLAYECPSYDWFRTLSNSSPWLLTQFHLIYQKRRSMCILLMLSLVQVANQTFASFKQEVASIGRNIFGSLLAPGPYQLQPITSKFPELVIKISGWFGAFKKTININWKELLKNLVYVGNGYDLRYNRLKVLQLSLNGLVIELWHPSRK